MFSNLAHDENPQLIPNMLHQRKLANASFWQTQLQSDLYYEISTSFKHILYKNTYLRTFVEDEKQQFVEF